MSNGNFKNNLFQDWNILLSNKQKNKIWTKEINVIVYNLFDKLNQQIIH